MITIVKTVFYYSFPPMLAQPSAHRVTALFTLLVGLFMGAYAWHFYTENSVILAHREFLERMQGENNFFLLLHPGIYWLSILSARLTGLEPLQAMHIWLCLHAAALPLVLAATLRVLDGGYASRGMVLAGALMVMIAASIPLPLVDQSVYNFSHINRSFLLLRNATHTAMVVAAPFWQGLGWRWRHFSSADRPSPAW